MNSDHRTSVRIVPVLGDLEFEVPGGKIDGDWGK